MLLIIIKLIALLILVDVVKFGVFLLLAVISAMLEGVGRPLGLPIRLRTDFEKKIFSPEAVMAMVSAVVYFWVYAFVFKPDLLPAVILIFSYLLPISLIITVMLSVDEDLADDFIDTDLEKEEVQAVSQEEIKMRISPKGWERFRLPWFESIYAIIGNLGLSILASLVSLLYFAFKSEEDIERKLPGQNDCEVDAWYEFERFYYQQQNFSFIDALMVTAKEVARWSNGFDAVIADPVSGTEMMRKRGELPKNESERQEYAEKLVWWITNKARFANVFQLTFYNTFPETHHEVTPMFGYCAKTGNWDLYLTEDRFLRLKNAWQKSGLPEDLFYPRIKRVTPRVSGFKLFLSRVFPLVDQQPYLTPREAKASDVMRKGE